jgi:hypothetical protein
MPDNAEPQAGDSYVRFNGRDAYVEIRALMTTASAQPVSSPFLPG